MHHNLVRDRWTDISCPAASLFFHTLHPIASGQIIHTQHIPLGTCVPFLFSLLFFFYSKGGDGTQGLAHNRQGLSTLDSYPSDCFVVWPVEPSLYLGFSLPEVTTVYMAQLCPISLFPLCVTLQFKFLLKPFSPEDPLKNCRVVWPSLWAQDRVRSWK